MVPWVVHQDPSPILNATSSAGWSVPACGKRGLKGWGFGGRELGENTALRKDIRSFVRRFGFLEDLPFGNLYLILKYLNNY